mgnify:CR=1 FL=1
MGLVSMEGIIISFIKWSDSLWVFLFTEMYRFGSDGNGGYKYEIEDLNGKRGEFGGW